MFPAGSISPRPTLGWLVTLSLGLVESQVDLLRAELKVEKKGGNSPVCGASFASPFPQKVTH